MKKVLGMGNALVDIMTRLDSDEYLARFGLPKGSMTLVDAEKSDAVLAGTMHLAKSVRSGGSAANTIHGLARLGLKTAFVGKIGRDLMGETFYDDLVKSYIQPVLSSSDTPSGKAIALVSPDSERTFATYLGAAMELAAIDIDDNLFDGFDFFHVEGYLVQNRPLLEKALSFARKRGMTVSLDMASYNIVEQNREFLSEMLKNYVDVVFANEDEARAFTGEEPAEALQRLSKLCPVAVVKVGPRGSLARKDGTTHQVGIIEVNSIDTTGAGDLYAAGFLYGLAHGLPIDRCGRIGAILAGNVIEVLGPKMDDERWDSIRKVLG